MKRNEDRISLPEDFRRMMMYGTLAVAKELWPHLVPETLTA
jgi:hypothetical protein